jgi:transcription-repair coupling factor (superfamily II helicase)
VAAEEVEAQLNLGLNIRIPAEYIAEENQRLRMYKRIAGVENDSQLADARNELEDRYGEPPQPVRNLLDYAMLRLLCNRVGVTRVERKRDLVSVNFTQNAVVDPEKLARFVSSQRGAQFNPGGTLKFFVKGASQAEEVLGRIRVVLEELTGVVSGPGAEETSGVRS